MKRIWNAEPRETNLNGRIHLIFKLNDKDNKMNRKFGNFNMRIHCKNYNREKKERKIKVTKTTI